MSNFPLKALALLAGVALVANGCGGSSGNRTLQSLSISPATASASGTPVQFTATGHWSQPPIAVTPQSATWGACTTAEVPTTEVTVSSAGVATCGSTAKGTYDVFAEYQPDNVTGTMCNAINACGGGCGLISTTAQLKCP